MKHILVCIIALALTVQAFAEDWQTLLLKDLGRIQAGDYRNALSSSVEVEGAMGAADQKLPECSIPAIFSLWLSEHSEYAELEWWRQRNRAVRAFVVALYYCAYDVQPNSEDWLKAGTFPSFEPKRFEEKEAREREEEIDYIIKHHSLFARILADRTEGIPRAKRMHDAYSTFAQVRK